MADNDNNTEKFVLVSSCTRFMNNEKEKQEEFDKRLEKIQTVIEDIPLIKKDVSNILNKIDSYNNFRERVAKLEGQACSQDGDVVERVAKLEQSKVDNVTKSDNKTKIWVSIITALATLLAAAVPIIILLLTKVIKIN